MATRKGVNRYPRPGDRIAPATLRQVLFDPLPIHLLGATTTAGRKLCDLDESVWEAFDSAAVDQLSEIIVERVAAGCGRKAFHHRHFPRPPEGMKLEDLRLEHRTHLCLAREGFEEDPEALGDHTLGEILAIRAFGPRCLVDLLSSLETLLARETRLYRELTAEAQRLAELPEARLVRRDDPRFRPLMDEVDLESDSAKELADRLVARSVDPPDPLYATEQVRQLRQRILAMPSQTLEEELIQIFASTPHQRNREIVIGYYGWRDGECHTLAEVGARHGMTRERTRQICAKLVTRKDPRTILAPVTDRTLDFLKERLPCSVTKLEQEMVDAGLTAVGLRLENVKSAAKLLARPLPLAVVRVDGGKLAVHPRQAAVPAAVLESARKEVYYHGASTVGRIRKVLSDRFPAGVGHAIVAETLQLIDGFRWLDQETGWFRLLSTCKHGLPKAIDKILAVSPQITAGELRAAVSRNRRMWQVAPPEKVILEFCRQTPGVQVNGDLIVADPVRDWKEALTGVEAELVRMLKRHGPVMERGALEDLCVGNGMNRFSFHAFIACSPVIAQYGHSVYGLLGVDVSPETVKSLIARRRAERAPTRVLDSHGRTDDGKIWLSYRLSKAASTYAVITVPAALKDSVSGRFQLLADDGRQVGTLAAKDGRAWGLGAFLRRSGARVDDRVVLTLDLERRTAVVSIREKSSTPATKEKA